jgi:hypothetical protein
MFKGDAVTHEILSTLKSLDVSTTGSPTDVQALFYFIPYMAKHV